MSRVFVYGTLKKGRGNHGVMERAGGRLISKATLHGFEMVSLGPFPAIRPSDGASVGGELYEVDSLGPLDWLEGYRGPGQGNFYDRQQVRVLAGDDVYDAWTYVLESAEGRIVPNGEW